MKKTRLTIEILKSKVSKVVGLAKKYYFLVITSDPFITYKPALKAFLLMLVFGILMAIVMGGSFASYALGAYFIIFGALEARNTKAFKKVFERYDVLAYWFPWYSSVYPYLSIFFGVLLIVDLFAFLIAFAAIVMFGTQAYGVWKILKREEKIEHINMGHKYTFPLSRFVFVESAVVILLALLILF